MSGAIAPAGETAPDTGAGAGARDGDGIRPRPTWAADAAILGVLATVFVALFVVFREAPFHYDPIEYFLTASRLEQAAPFHRSLRIGLLLPVRLAQGVLGYSQAAYYAVPLASGLLLLGATYVLGRTVGSRWVGAAAATLVTLTTPVFGSVHQLWPDLPATAVFTAAMAGTMVLCKRYGRDGRAPDAAAHLAFVAVGLAVGWSYLIREFTIVLFPAILLPFWQYRTSWRLVLPGAVGALAAFGGELAFNATVHDDAFIRIRDLVTRQSEAPQAHVLDIFEARARDRGGFLERLTVFPGHLTTGRVPLLAGVGALAAASPLLVRREQRRALVTMLGWLLFYWVFVLYLSLDVDEFGRALHIEKVRYWYPVLPPLVVAGCLGASALVGRVRSGAARRAAGTVLVLAVVLGIGVEMADRAAAQGEGEPHRYEQIRRWLATEGSAHDSLATTQRTRWLLRIYTNGPFGEPLWEGRTRALNVARTFVELDQVDTDLVVVDDTFFEARRSNWREATPDWLLDLPDDWRPVAASDDGEVVVYERDSEPLAFTPVAAGWSSSEDTVTLDADGAATTTLAAGQRADLAAVVDAEAGAGAVVVVETVITTAGEGDVVPYCYFFGADGQQVRKDASSLWGVGFAGPKPLQAACTVPSELAPPVEVRFGLAARGPVDLDVTQPERVTVRTSTAWRSAD